MSAPHWGVLPETLAAELYRREWGSAAKRQRLLRGERPFPLSVNLKPPTSKQALQNPQHCQAFVAAWKQVLPQQVVWETRQLQHFGSIALPQRLVLADADSLLALIGEQGTWARWQTLIARVTEVTGCRDAVTAQVEALDRLPEHELAMLLRVWPQLQPGMGQGAYLRALPLAGAHSKFVEQHEPLLLPLLAACYGEAVSAQGLGAWLGCQAPPKDWLLVRPLDAATQAALGGWQVLRLPTEQLRRRPLPGVRVLIVENEQSCLSLPQLPDTVAVAGGGRNTAWLDAPWLADKQVAYWGDIDRHGLSILSRARQRLPTMTALLMNEAALAHGRNFCTTDPSSGSLAEPEALNKAERRLWQQLHRSDPPLRLEQEYVTAEDLARELAAWISGSLKNA